jgi:hypothetical protein
LPKRLLGKRVEPGWLVDNGLSGYNFFWPAINVSSPTCGTNLSDVLQPAVTRAATNFLGVPTMCGTDFDLYFADNIEPRNPYLQIVFTSAAVSGAGSSSASLGPLTIQMQDTSSGTAVPLTASSATSVALSSSSLTGTFSLTPQGSPVTSVTIPEGSSSATFYYGDTTDGTPQIIADPGTMVPGTQIETITSGVTVAGPLMLGRGRDIATNKANAHLTMRGQFAIPRRMQLQLAALTIEDLLHEDSKAGELLRRNGGSRGALPLTLAPIRGSTADDAVYATRLGVTPAVRVNLTKNAARPRESSFQISVDDAQINSALHCASRSTTLLHTRMTARDFRGQTAQFDADLVWSCESNHELATLPVRSSHRNDRSERRMQLVRRNNN